MKKFKDIRSGKSLLKSFLIGTPLIIYLFLSSPIHAQYSFSALKGTFTPLNDGKPVNSIQRYSSISGTIDIGFTFKFNGHPYDRIKASASGFITFKKFATWDGMDSSVIAPLGFNALSGEKGNASYKTEGTAPQRVFTFEWLNWKWDWDAAKPGISFQVKLYETSNRIEFIYRQEAGELNKPFARIGLMFQLPGKSIFLSDASDNPKAYSNVSYYIYQKPATGQIYRFDELLLPEPSNHVNHFVNEKSDGISLKWNDAKGSDLPERYLILVSDKSFEDILLPEDGKEFENDLNLKDGDGAVYVNYGIQKFTNFTELKVNSTYFFEIFPVNNYFTNTNYKTDQKVEQLKVNTSVDLSNISINIAESVLQNTSNDIQYSINSSDGINGNWTDCDLVKTVVDFKTGGYDLWVRQISNQSNKLKLGYISAPAKAPAFSINYILATTNENIPQTAEYSLDAAMLSGGISGNNIPVELTPSSLVYFRIKATPSALASYIQTMIVPARPVLPSFSFDFFSEKTLQIIPASVEYASSFNMENAVSGNNEVLTIIPGQSIYFRYIATLNEFSSAIQTLSVPERSLVPSFTINYLSETTSQILSADHEYSYSQDFNSSATGQELPLALTPGNSLFIRRKATQNTFKSDVQNLTVPKRPQAPSQIIVDDIANTFDWDFVGNFSKFSDYEYSIDDGRSWKTCDFKPTNIGNINIERGLLKLRIKATPSSFKGDFVVSEIAFTATTGIAGLEDAGIRFYPNPVDHTLYLENLPENSTVSILNSSGTIAIQKSTEKYEKAVISITGLSNGMYFIRVTTRNAQYQSKFIKI